MPQDQSPLDEFMSASTAKPTKCVSCTFLKAEEASEAMRVFAAAKEAGETTQDWKAFHKFLVSEYDYPVGCFSMRRHMRECLGL